MNSTYLKLEKIWNACSVKGSSALLEIIPLFKDCGIRLRQNDDSLKQITLSIATTKENPYVVGLRYIKNNGTFTEDHFLCEIEGVGLNGKEIVHHPKRKLEYKLPEYKGTHKETPNINSVQPIKLLTDVSTYSYFGNFDKNV